MASFAENFEDEPDDEFGPPPLPPDDRIWRHPSELGSATGPSLAARLGLSGRNEGGPPTKASAWTAGIVGALLATGLVALGTHFAGAFAGGPSTNAPQAAESTLTTLAVGTPAVSGIGTTLLSSIERIGPAVVLVDIAGRQGEQRCLGIVVRQDGMIVVPSVSLAGASSLLVDLSNGSQDVGEIVGSDPPSGIAVVHVNGVTHLPTATLAGTTPKPGAMIAAVTGSQGASYAAGTLQGLDEDPSVGGQALVNVITTDVTPTTSPLGSPLINSAGEVVGIVTGSTPSGVVATPSWLAAPVVDELISAGHVSRGWLGISARPAADDHGVEVASVASKGGAFEAGVRTGDVISAIDGHAVNSVAGLEGRLYVLRPGSTVRLSILRENKGIALVVPLDDGPSG